jgi:hypothetical protein
VKDIYLNFFISLKSYEKFLEQVGPSKILHREVFPERYAVVYIK